MNANAVLKEPGEPWRWLLGKQKVGSLSHCTESCSSVVVDLPVLHKEYGEGEGGRKDPTHPSIQLPNFLADEAEARRGGMRAQAANPCSRRDLNRVPGTHLYGRVITLSLKFSNSTWVHLIICSFEVTFFKFSLDMQLNTSFP